MAEAKRDGNRVPSLIAVSNIDGLTPVTVYADPSTHELLVSGAGGGSGNGAILDGVDTAIKATVLDLTSSNPLTTAIVDANGDQISSFGGGTQYTEDAASAANPVGTALNLIRDDARSGSLTTADGDNVAARGTNSGELYVKHVDTIPATQSGTWNITNVSGTVSLPTGASTSAKQDTGNTSLASIDGKITAVNTGAVVVSSSALPTGASTAAKQPALGTAGTASSDVITVQGIASMTPMIITGNIASAATDSGSPVKIGAKYNATLPTFTDGQRGDLNINSRGVLKVIQYPDNSNTPYIGLADNVDGVTVSATANKNAVTNRNTVFNGTSWDRQYGDATSGTWVNIKSSVTLTANATLGAETTKVIGVTRTADGAGNLLTSNSTTYTAKFGLDSNLLGTLGTAFTTAGKVDVKGADGDVFVRQATSSNLNADVNLKSIAGTNIVTGGVAGSQSVGGTVATNVAITANPINLGAQAVSSENAAVTTARQVQLVADLVGKLIVLPYANPENFVSGAITSAMTGTTSTSLIAAPASGLRNYITQITVSNAHATVGTDVIIQDGSGGTTLYTIPAAAVYGGAVLTFPTPLRQPTTATAIYCANVTTGASTKVSASGYKGV